MDFVLPALFLLGLVGLFLLLSIVIIVALFLRKRRLAIWSGAGVGLIILGCLSIWGIIYAYDHRPPAAMAADIVKLPPQAVVKTATYSDKDGCDAVTFTLPPTRTDGQWMATIWSLNSISSRQGGFAVTAGSSSKGSMEWDGTGPDQDDLVTLLYDRGSHIYTFKR